MATHQPRDGIPDRSLDKAQRCVGSGLVLNETTYPILDTPHRTGYGSPLG